MSYGSKNILHAHDDHSRLLGKVRDVGDALDDFAARVDASVRLSVAGVAMLTGPLLALRPDAPGSDARWAGDKLPKAENVANLVVAVVLADLEGFPAIEDGREELGPCFQFVGFAHEVKILRLIHLQRLPSLNPIRRSERRRCRCGDGRQHARRATS